MCGFAGLLTAEPMHADVLRGMVERMRDTLVHRGPDDAGVWVEPYGRAGFGFRRLSIIDLSELGHQPMSSPSGRYTILFNGEIFNYRELRTELASRGATFRGHSDTQVLVNALDIWGIDGTLPRLLGMYAIAVWDHNEALLHLVRDRLGKKPLYVYQSNGMVLFGSELKALAASPAFERRLNVDAVQSYLRYMYVPAPATIYDRTVKVRPGHCMTFSSARDAGRSSAYWSLEEACLAARAQPFDGDDEDATSELERLLDDAVRLRLESDVPLGSLLSGGIDSSTVTALMQRNSSRPVRTFSIGFDAAEHDESVHARAVAQHIGTEHTALTVTGADALGVVPMLANMFDEPHADPSQIPTYLVCALARQDVTVALTGDGGDEIFAGYHRYMSGRGMINRLQPLPRPARSLLRATLTNVPAGAVEATLRATGRQTRLVGEKVAKLGRMLEHGDAGRMYRSLLSAAWDRPDHALLRAAEDTDEVTTLLLRRFRELPLLDRMMLVDQLTYLPDDLLAKVDRASMAVSLEARVPILDHRIVEFSWRLPHSMKIRDGRGKYVLRRVLDRHVPRALIDRPKVGFSVPLDQWLRGPLRQWVDDLFATLDEPLDARRIRARWDRYQRGTSAADALALWSVAVFQAWRTEWRPH